MKYVQVVLPISHKNVDKPFTYAVPDYLLGKLFLGMAVHVPFGAGNKLYEAYITGFSNTVEFKTKEVIGIVTENSFLTQEMINLALWMKEKYYTTLANCLKVILPPTVVKPRKRKVSISSDFSYIEKSDKKILNQEQQQAVDICLICSKKEDKKPILIHGVTGSGKTEVYMEIIEQIISEGKQAIVLVPEISLTPQTVARFTNRFGELVNFTHSKLSAGERHTQWEAARCGDISIIIGPRSGVFAPFPNLGIIIIDEEHESSYKSETTPKYDAIQIAKKRGELEGATVVLGSATPSIHTYFNAQSGFYEYIELKQRVNQRPPDINVIDMRAELKLGNTSIFGDDLQKAIQNNLDNNLQTILFLNRRGHSTFVSCRACGHVCQCEQCSVNYTFHKYNNSLLCHYCGLEAENPANCPVCGSKFIKYFGIGTQRVEKETSELFPQARILRMDLDTTTKKHAHKNILDTFRVGDADILIGTQMIAKGLDFPKVTLVGIIAADIGLNAGDYRSGEITYQLMTQVAGRAGRSDYPGTVYIQTYNPEHYAIIHATTGDYSSFYKQEISLRRQMFYPPFSHVFMILAVSYNEKELIQTMFHLRAIMDFYIEKRPIFEALGPTPATISKVQNKYRWKIIVKSETEEKLKNFVLYTLQKLEQEININNINFSITLDPAVIL